MKYVVRPDSRRKLYAINIVHNDGREIEVQTESSEIKANAACKHLNLNLTEAGRRLKTRPGETYNGRRVHLPRV